MPKQRIGIDLSNSGEPITAAFEVPGAGGEQLEIAAEENHTVLQPLLLDPGRVRSLLIVSDTDVQLELKGEKDLHERSLLAGVPLLWYAGIGVPIEALLPEKVDALQLLSPKGNATVKVRVMRS